MLRGPSAGFLEKGLRAERVPGRQWGTEVSQEEGRAGSEAWVFGLGCWLPAVRSLVSRGARGPSPRVGSFPSSSLACKKERLLLSGSENWRGRDTEGWARCPVRGASRLWGEPGAVGGPRQPAG